MTREQIILTLRAFLDDTATLSLATVNGDGLPHAANVNFAVDADLNLLFVSHPKSAHSEHLNARPRVAATVYAPFISPDQIRGLQIKGTCATVSDDRFQSTLDLFFRKFPYAHRFEQRIRAERFYQVTPTWFRYIDNTERFGSKWETDWPLLPS